jgi:hypothetical protein
MALPNLAGVLMDPMNFESCEVLGVAVTESSGGSPLSIPKSFILEIVYCDADKYIDVGREMRKFQIRHFLTMFVIHVPPPLGLVTVIQDVIVI